MNLGLTVHNIGKNYTGLEEGETPHIPEPLGNEFIGFNHSHNIVTLGFHTVVFLFVKNSRIVEFMR